MPILQASGGLSTMVVAVASLLGVLYVLTRLDRFSWPLYGFFTLIVVVLATNAMGFNVIGVFLSSPIWPMIALGLLYLVYKAIEAYRESNTTVIEVAGDKVKRT
jgi:hypothetical protein